MSNRKRELKEKGEFDYDYAHDVLFFKVKDRPYDRSLELDNLVVDIDEEGFVVGLQIFDASAYFRMDKKHLKVASMWKMWANVEKLGECESLIEIRLVFQVLVRNRIVEQRPIITQNVRDGLESSQMVCVPAK